MLTRVFSALGISLVLSGVLLLPFEALASDRQERSISKAERKVERRNRRAVPEINAQHAGTAVALVAGGVAVVLGRRRRRENA